MTLIRKIIEDHKKKTGIINVILTNDSNLIDLNKRYLSRDYLTDIITFDYSSEDTISGELYISIERVKENANKYKVIIKNELLRVIIHGILHLNGYKDEKSSEARKMRKIEDKYLKVFKYYTEGIERSL